MLKSRNIRRAILPIYRLNPIKTDVMDNLLFLSLSFDHISNRFDNILVGKTDGREIVNALEVPTAPP